MKAILSIAKITLIEQIRNRLYLVILFFGATILVASLLVGALAPGYRVRVIFDLGLVAIEIFGLITAVFGAVNLVLQEVETKTIYLILTRPVNRMSYLFGRFVGLIVAVAATMVFMALIHILVIVFRPYQFQVFLERVDFWHIYPLIIAMSIGKMFMTTAIALFFSLFATSSVSALIFTVSFWVAGHFGTELAFLIDTSFKGVAAILVHFISWILPNFQYFNFRDIFSFPNFSGYQYVGKAWMYGVGYASFFLALSSFLFSKKEF